jgi:hypothetical protein
MQASGVMQKCFQAILAAVALTTAFNLASNAAEIPSEVERKICTQRGEYVVFAQHPLFWGAWSIPGARNPVFDTGNIELSHEHIFFCNDSFVTENVGFGPTGRFNFSQLAVRANMRVDGGRINDFRPIDNERYNPDIVRMVLGSQQVLSNRCELRPDGIYGGVVNNCQGFTARIRESYWRYMFQGTWNAEGYQCPLGTYHKEVISMQVSGNSLVATKTDGGGDRCVPTGSRTFSGSIPNNVSKGSSFSITYVVGDPNNPASETAPGQLMIVDANTLYSGSSTGEGITFRRAERR